MLLKVLDEREKWWAPILAKKEADRTAAINKTKTELEAHEKAIAPKLAEMEKQRLEKVKTLEADYKKLETSVLAAKVAEYRRPQLLGTIKSFRFSTPAATLPPMAAPLPSGMICPLSPVAN